MAKKVSFKKIILWSSGIIGGLILIFSITVGYKAYEILTQPPINYIRYESFDMPIDSCKLDFKKVTQIVKDYYSLFENKGIDPDSLNNKYMAEVNQIESPKEYIDVLLRYFAALKNTHSRLGIYRTGFGVGAMWVEDHLYINRIDDPSTSNLQINDRIIAIEGLNIDEKIEQDLPYTTASTDKGRRRNAVFYNTFVTHKDSVRNLTIERAGKIHQVSLAIRTGDYVKDTTSQIEHRTINDSIGYINIREMTGEVVADFAAAYKEIKHLPYLIVDVRGNSGGNSGYGDKINQYLINKEFTTCVGKRTKLPHPDSYTGKLFLLTSIRTCSAAESFALDLKENKAAILVGEPTCGDTGNRPTYFTTKAGTSFRIPTANDTSPKGFVMEGEGIAPDYEVSPTAKDYLAGVDGVLEFVVEGVVGL